MVTVEDQSCTQQDELEALCSIYGEDFVPVEPNCKLYSIRVSTKHDQSVNDPVVLLEFQYFPDTTSTVLLEYRLYAPSIEKDDYDVLSAQLSELVQNAEGMPIVHLMVETIRIYLDSLPCDELTSPIPPNLFDGVQSETIKGQNSTLIESYPNSVASVRAHLVSLPSLMPVAVGVGPLQMFHGDTLVDRRSVFQAHCCRASSVGQVSLFISTLLDDKKIAMATHNILAWRIVVQPDGKRDVVLSDCDDDGETHAGGRLLHLLNICDVQNVALIVTRWYGGIQLGPDRFKHINNVARQILVANSLIPSHSKSQQPQQKSDKNRKQKKKKLHK